MACRVITVIFIIIAVVLAIMSVTTSQQAFTAVVVVSRFFEVMIPVLGVAALLKFITCGKSQCCNKANNGDSNSCSTKFSDGASHGEKHHH